MRPRTLLLLAAIALFLALATGFALTFRLVYAIVAAVGLAALWRYGLLRDTTAERRVSAGFTQVGGSITDWLTIKNSGWLPQLWIRVEDQSNLAGHNLSAVVAVRPRSEQTWFRRTVCTLRGVYRLGPVDLIAGDPWGLFEVRRQALGAREIIVYPRPVPLPGFGVPVAALPGEGRQRRPSHQPAPNAFTIREYVHGDSFNRIHWPSSARLGRLIVKEFELDPANDVWIVLDGDLAVQAGSGAESTQEYGVTIAASIAHHYLTSNRAVGLIASGEPPISLPTDRGDRQWPRILQMLAAYRAHGDLPLATVLGREAARFGRTSTLIIITSSVADEWPANLQAIMERGVRLAVVLLEAETFGRPANILLTISSLAGLGIPTYLVKQGDDLARALNVEQLDRADSSARAAP